MTKLTPEAEARLAALSNAGRITPEDVVQDAADPESPLHPYFDWDDAQAAHKHRLEQARTILKVKVQYNVNNVLIRVPMHVRDVDQGRGQGYVAVSAVTERDVALRTIGQELARIESLIVRARNLAKVLDCEAELEATLQQLVHWRERLRAA
jgi:hypothetical protein